VQKSATYRMPLTSWIFERRASMRRVLASIHIRSATMNQTKAMAARGMR
jgi:hypothetical protein